MFGIVIPLVFDILPFVEFKKVMGVFPFIAGIIGIDFFLGVTSDGNITTGSGNTINYLLSASNTSTTWQGVVLIFGLLALAGFLLTIYVALKGER